MASATMEEKILKKLDELTAEVQELRRANERQAKQLEALQGLRAGREGDAQLALLEQIARSAPSLTKWIRTLDQLMELKEDLGPLSKPMFEELVVSLDEATHTFDLRDFKELLRQVVLNLANLAELVKMAGGLVDLTNEMTPLAKDAFSNAIISLEGLKQKGFFDSMGAVLRVLEAVGQRTHELDPAKVQPINGLFGLYGAMKKPEVRYGLGVLVELLSVLSVVKALPAESTTSAVAAS